MDIKTKEVEITRTVEFGVTSYNLFRHGITYCPVCGNEVVHDYGICWNNCINDSIMLENSNGDHIPIFDTRRYKLNDTAMNMISRAIDWTGIDIHEWFVEYGTTKAVAEELGVSTRTVKRRLDAVIAEESGDVALNSFY